MPIEQSTDNGRTVFSLSDGETELEIEILPGEPEELRLWSDDVHLIELAEEQADGWNPSKEEFVDAVEDGLDLVLDHVVVEDAAAYEASFTVTEDSIVIAGARWGGPKDLYPG